MQTVLEQGSIDKPLTFDVGLIQLSFIPVCSLNTCNISVKLCRGFALQCFSFLIGDFAYPLNTWLMKPFPHNGVLTTEQKTFNYRFCRARIVVENAYGCLKARWRRLMKRNDMHVRNIPNVVAVACILHNM